MDVGRKSTRLTYLAKPGNSHFTTAFGCAAFQRPRHFVRPREASDSNTQICAVQEASFHSQVLENPHLPAALRSGRKSLSRPSAKVAVGRAFRLRNTALG